MAEISAPLNATGRAVETAAGTDDVAGQGGRPAIALILAAVLLPALLFGAFAWWSWQRVQSEATAQIERTTDLLAEQGLRLLRIEELLLTETDLRLRTLDWPYIVRHEAELDADLRTAVADVPEIDGLYVVDPTGEVRLGTRSTRVMGAPPSEAGVPSEVNVASRPFFQAALHGVSFVISSSTQSLATGVPIVTVARRLSGSDGSFHGVAVVAVPVDRLEQTWHDVVQPGDAVALIRSDGAFLARYPEAPSLLEGGARTMPRLMARVSGIFEAQSSGFDHVPRRIGFRRLTPFPLYLTYAVDESNIVRQWYPVAIAFGALAAAAALALVFASTAMIRRARSEALAHAAAERTAVALRRSEETQRALFRKAPAAMHSLDGDRRIIDVNDRWLDLFGYGREEVVGRPIADFYVLADDAERDARWNLILTRGGTEDEERECIAKNGDIFYGLVSVAIERDDTGALVRVITTVTDITLRKRAEAAAQRAENFAQLLIESSLDGIIIKDRALRYTVFNRAMEELSGIPRAAVFGRTVAEVFPELASPAVEDAWRSALEGRSTVLQDRSFAFSPPGRAGYFDQTVAPLRDAGGAIIGALSIVRETTERRRVEEALRQAQKMEAVGQLTGGIAHDFNNLLTIIIGNIEQLQHCVPPGSELLRYADAAARGAERAATLTQRLLAFSRRQPLAPQPLDLNRVVAGVSDMLRRALGESVTLETVLAGGLWRVFADANQIENALLNLAVNARDAMPEGGRLTIETANTTLNEAAADAEGVTPGPYVTIAVSDTGSGMSEEVKTRAFEPFYTTKETGRGSGLGLSQVYGFTRQSGGCAAIVSALGKGTTVRLYLPRLEGDVATERAKAPERAAPPRAYRGRAVLVVEDDRDVRAHNAGLLRELGYRVIEAGDGAEALAAIDRGEDIDLLFTDVGLPGGLDGRALAAEALDRRPGLKVLFTTGYAAGRLAGAERLPAVPHLIPKPFTFSALAAKVHAVLAPEPEEA